MKLYEYAVIYTPPKKKDQEQERSELIVDITRILCHNEREAQMMAARSIPDAFTSKLDCVEIALRPF